MVTWRNMVLCSRALLGTGLDDKSERFSWFFDDKMKNLQPIFTKIDT